MVVPTLLIWMGWEIFRAFQRKKANEGLVINGKPPFHLGQPVSLGIELSERRSQKGKSPIASATGLFRDPGRIRTPNPQSRNLIFYPVELRGQRGGEITMQNAIPATFLCALLFGWKR